jgi:hypothetical protein
MNATHSVSGTGTKLCICLVLCTNSRAHTNFQTACTFTPSSSHWRSFSQLFLHTDTHSPCAGTPAVRPRISGAARCVSIVALPPPPPRLPARTHSVITHTRKSERLCVCACAGRARLCPSVFVCVCVRACKLHAEVSAVYTSTSMHFLRFEPLDKPSRGAFALCPSFNSRVRLRHAEAYL